jgi:hypothetical protein
MYYVATTGLDQVRRAFDRTPGISARQPYVGV